MAGRSAIWFAREQTVLGNNGDSWATPWSAFPPSHANAELWFNAKTLLSGSDFSLMPQTTWDTDEPIDLLASPISLTSVVSSFASISSALGPLVRLRVTSNANGSKAVLSALLAPKSQ
jgi:hypothetical protein